MRNRYFISAALAALTLVGAGCLPAERTEVPERVPAAVPSASEPSVPEAAVQGTGGDGADERVVPTGEVRIFEVVGDNFSFSIKEIKVKTGDRVRIVFQNIEGFHDWKIDEFNAATKQLPAGASETVEFLADRSGNFEYYCSVGKHRAMGMVGRLIVE